MLFSASVTASLLLASNSLVQACAPLSDVSSTPGCRSKGNGKRGLAYNIPSDTRDFSSFSGTSKVSWTYNWASSAYYLHESEQGQDTYQQELDFVPMLWSDDQYLRKVWARNVADSTAWFGSNTLLAFNEPDNCLYDGACMTVDESVATYLAAIQPFAGQYRLGAPAVMNSGNPGMGMDYLRKFMKACTGCTIDFLPIHFYGDINSISQFFDYVQAAHEEFKMPIWVTEFGTHGHGGSPEQVQKWLLDATAWLDSQSYVEKYAYYMTKHLPDGNGLVGLDGNMNALGKAYDS